MEKISRRGTGKRIRKLQADRGITVRMVQEKTELESPQAVYKWLNGKTLPSTENLLILSRLLNMPMEKLLVQERKCEEEEADEETGAEDDGWPDDGWGKKEEECWLHICCEIPTHDIAQRASQIQEEIERANEKESDQSKRSS